MTDVASLPNGDAGQLTTGFLYGWVPGSPAVEFKIPITELAALGLATAKFKDPVRVASTVNGALATAYENGDTLDGVVLATGNRILLKNQTTASENGIYTVNAAGAPSRTSDADTGSELVNAMVPVSEGTQADTLWQCLNNAPIVVGTDALNFQQFGARKRNLTMSITGTALAGSEVLAAITPPLGETWTFSANFASASGKKLTGGTNPAASYAIDVSKNGATVGTITISNAGVVSFATAAGAAFALVGGTDELRFIGPGTTDTAVGYAFAIPFSY